MPRRSLRPQLNQIRTWVRQGRTDAWIAHQLEVTTQQIAAFKRENELVPDEAEPNGAVDFDDEIDLRAEDDALIAAELEAAQKQREQEEAEAAKKAAAQTRAAEPRRARRGPRTSDEDEDGEKPSRRRGRRGGRRRKARAGGRSRARSTTATRATACGSTPPCRTTPSTPSTGPATVPSRSRSRKTRS